jgi:hypothetical protein
MAQNKTEKIYVLVTGSRDDLTDKDKELIIQRLQWIEKEYLSNINSKIYALSNNKTSSNICLVHGACSGVDTYASRVARELKWSIQACPAQWSKYGKSAGPRRNQEMIDTYRPHVTLAFPSPGSKGTLDAITRILAYEKSPQSRLVHKEINYIETTKK